MGREGPVASLRIQVLLILDGAFPLPAALDQEGGVRGLVAHSRAVLERKHDVGVVTIDASLIMKVRNKEHVLQSARALMDIEFGFRYIRDERGNANRMLGVFVTTVEDIKGTDFLSITIYRDILPVLTYYGPSAGGTLLLRDPELETKDHHAKIIRSMLISRKGIGSWRESLGDFKMMLGLSTEYRPSCLKKDILEPVRKWLLENSDIWFEYEMLAEKIPGRKARAESIFFWVYSSESPSGDRKYFGDYTIV